MGEESEFFDELEEKKSRNKEFQKEINKRKLSKIEMDELFLL